MADIYVTFMCNSRGLMAIKHTHNVLRSIRESKYYMIASKRPWPLKTSFVISFSLFAQRCRSCNYFVAGFLRSAQICGQFCKSPTTAWKFAPQSKEASFFFCPFSCNTLEKNSSCNAALYCSFLWWFLFPQNFAFFLFFGRFFCSLCQCVYLHACAMDAPLAGYATHSRSTETQKAHRSWNWLEPLLVWQVGHQFTSFRWNCPRQYLLEQFMTCVSVNQTFIMKLSCETSVDFCPADIMVIGHNV